MSKYFTDVSDLAELKKTFKKLAMENHPDLGGDTKTMQEIIQEYDSMFKKLSNNEKYKKYHETDPNKYRKTKHSTFTIDDLQDDGYRVMIMRIIGLDGLKIELCGRWVWVSGEKTKQHKDILKSAGFFWSKEKMMWYWRPLNEKNIFYSGQCSMDEIRSRYGSEEFVKQQMPKLTAAQ